MPVPFELLNPEAELIKDLASLNLIAIRETTPRGFIHVLVRLCSQLGDAPGPDEIAREVDIVRSQR